jgi:hypothetical protein
MSGQREPPATFVVTGTGLPDREHDLGQPPASSITLRDKGCSETDARSYRIVDEQFMADLQKLKDLRSFLIEQAVHLKRTDATELSFGDLNLLIQRGDGRAPTRAEWESLEALTQKLFSHLTDPLRRRFLSSRLAWWVPGLSVGLGLTAIFSLIMCSLTWSHGGYERIIPWYVLWLASLGAIGSISFIGMNALSVQYDATFDLTNTRLILLRIALGSLFGLVLTLPFGYNSFVEFISFLLNGGTVSTDKVQPDAVNKVQQSALLLLPFVFGFSTSLVIMVLNQFVEAVQTLFGKKTGSSNLPPAGS